MLLVAEEPVSKDRLVVVDVAQAGNMAGIHVDELRTNIQELFGISGEGTGTSGDLPVMTPLDGWLRSAQFLVKAYAGSAIAEDLTLHHRFANLLCDLHAAEAPQGDAVPRTTAAWLGGQSDFYISPETVKAVADG